MVNPTKYLVLEKSCRHQHTTFKCWCQHLWKTLSFCDSVRSSLVDISFVFGVEQILPTPAHKTLVFVSALVENTELL